MMEFLYAYQSIYTVFVFVIFIIIILWAWSSKNKASFNETARSILEDNDEVIVTTSKKENSNG